MRTVWLFSRNLLLLERVRGIVGAGGPSIRLLGEARPGDLVLVDLTAADALDAIARVRTIGAEVVAFGPHKQADLLRRAREAGAERVVANSALRAALAQTLQLPGAPGQTEGRGHCGPDGHDPESGG